MPRSSTRWTRNVTLCRDIEALAAAATCKANSITLNESGFAIATAARRATAFPSRARHQSAAHFGSAAATAPRRSLTFVTGPCPHALPSPTGHQAIHLVRSLADVGYMRSNLRRVLVGLGHELSRRAPRSLARRPPRRGPWSRAPAAAASRPARAIMLCQSSSLTASPPCCRTPRAPPRPQPLHSRRAARRV